MRQRHGLARQAVPGLAGAALLIGGVTVIARIVGFSRNLVFSHTVGTNCLATTYFTANQVTNIVFEVVAGGALASMVVPVLAGPAGRRDQGQTRQIAAALMSWTILLLLPLSALAAALARPVMTLLVPAAPGCVRADVVAVGARMLAVFAPQIVLYGIAVVLYGILQSHRRFLAPALAPLVSSLVVIGAYLGYVPFRAPDPDDLAHLPRVAELVISIGTTLGVLALVVTAAVPATRLRLRLRPTLGFPPGVARVVRRLAVAGLAALVAQQAAWVAVLVLANGQGGAGAIAIYNYAFALYQVPYAVLALPVATSAFPTLAAHPDDEEFDRTAASATRAVVLLSGAGAVALVVTATPVARVFLPGSAHDNVAALSAAIVAFAPGLVGYGLLAHLGRVLYACGRGRAAAAAQVTGWLAVIAAESALALTAPRPRVVAALGLGNTLGMALAGTLLAVIVARLRGRRSFEGWARASFATAFGGVGGCLAGRAVAGAYSQTGLAGSVGVAALAGLVALAVFGVVVFVVDRRDLVAVVTRRGR